MNTGWEMENKLLHLENLLDHLLKIAFLSKPSITGYAGNGGEHCRSGLPTTLMSCRESKSRKAPDPLCNRNTNQPPVMSNRSKLYAMDRAMMIALIKQPVTQPYKNVTKEVATLHVNWANMFVHQLNAKVAEEKDGPDTYLS
jgi:hypothetical protein